MNIRPVLVLALGLILLAAPALAHVPGFVDENTSHETASHIDDGAKSRSIYTALDGREARYFEVHLEPGDRLQVSTFTPDGEGFAPGFVIYGEDIEQSGTVPEWVDIPDGMNAIVVPGSSPEAPEFEPFTPAAYYQTASMSIPAERGGHYWIAVYEPTGASGQVGTAIGYEESFTLAEYLLVPIDLVEVHLWEGDNPILLVGPFLVTGLAVALYLARRWNSVPSRRQVGLGVAGGLFLGGAVGSGIQFLMAVSATGIVPAATVSLGLVLVPLAVGAWLVRVARTARPPSPGSRVGVAIAALLGFLTWGGLLLGPALAVVVAVAGRPTPSD